MINYIETDELLEKWREIVNGNKPHASIRIGDSEAAVAAHEEILTMNFIISSYTWVQKKDISYCGVILPNRKIREQLVGAFRQADFLGLLWQTDSWMFKPLAEMVVQYYNLYPQNFFYAFDNYLISTKKDFYEYFKNKSILLVGSKSKFLKEVLERRYGWSGIVGYVDCRNWNYVEMAKSAMDRYKYRLALVSAGVPGKILTSYAKAKGNVGIDFGSGADTCLESDASGLFAWEMKDLPKRNYHPSNASKT